MNTTGIYEQLITQLVEQNLDRETFHVGERLLEAGEAATWLSRFLTRLIEMAMDSVPNGDTRIHDQINLANTIVQWLSTHIKDEQLISENLIDSQGKILTALFDKTNPIAADLPKYVESIMPITGLTQSELFCGSNVGVSLETEIKREIQSSDKIYWLVSAPCSLAANSARCLESRPEPAPKSRIRALGLFIMLGSNYDQL